MKPYILRTGGSIGVVVPHVPDLQMEKSGCIPNIAWL